MYKKLSVALLGTLILLIALESSGTFQIASADHDDENEEDVSSDDDFEEENSIQICCAWGEKLADGSLTYKISGSDSDIVQAVRTAIEDWDYKIIGLELDEINKKKKEADIEVSFEKDGEEIAGQTVNNFNGFGLIDNAEMTISKNAFGRDFDTKTIEQIAKHEMGHALGLGHANFGGNLMTELVNDGTGTIDECEIKSVYEANQWKLKDGSDSAYAPSKYDVEC
ncbi:MAG TPA: matrixin family metalloprotease [Nitrososphaeraceae archaeon]|nr:matrixin family metalloprotease [Nitrososphaeraceae archaeon]